MEIVSHIYLMKRKTYGNIIWGDTKIFDLLVPQYKQGRNILSRGNAKKTYVVLGALHVLVC